MLLSKFTISLPTIYFRLFILVINQDNSIFVTKWKGETSTNPQRKFHWKKRTKRKKSLLFIRISVQWTCVLKSLTNLRMISMLQWIWIIRGVWVTIRICYVKLWKIFVVIIIKSLWHLSVECWADSYDDGPALNHINVLLHVLWLFIVQQTRNVDPMF